MGRPKPASLLRRRRESYGKPPSQSVSGLAELVKLGPIIGIEKTPHFRLASPDPLAERDLAQTLARHAE
jgi:hypothetical protein